MKAINLGTIMLAMASLISCASVQGPPEDLLTRLPVVEVGQPEPADKQYVLHIRAGQPMPVRFTMKGPLLLQPTQGTAQMQFAHSLYIYKDWSSLDGLNWTRQGFDGAVSFGLAPKGGLVDIHVGWTN
jgi:hypothetical protein